MGQHKSNYEINKILVILRKLDRFQDYKKPINIEKVALYFSPQDWRPFRPQGWDYKFCQINPKNTKEIWKPLGNHKES